MGFRLQRSIKIAPGLRLNLSKSGLGLSVGVPGLRKSFSPTGRVQSTAGIPGTGLSWRTYSSTDRRNAPASAPVPYPTKPGWFAPKGEKELYAALPANDPTAMEAIAEAHADVAVVAATFAGLGFIGRHEDAKARDLLERVYSSGEDPAQHPFFRRYIAGAHVELGIAPGVRATLPIDRNIVGLALAELYQEAGDIARAAITVEQLEPTNVTAVSLAELYCALDRSDDVIALTEGISNADDGTALLCVYRGTAFAHKGFHDAAREAFKEALRARSRNALIRHKALWERAQVNLADGKNAMARRDLEKILAEDSDFPGLQEALAQITSA